MHKVIATGDDSFREARIVELEYELKEKTRRLKIERWVWSITHAILVIIYLLPF